MGLEWRGDDVKRHVLQATLGGMDETLAACVRTAKPMYRPGHGLVTATLQGSIQMRPAQLRGDVVVGVWGSFDVNYAIYVEMGTGKMAAQGQLRRSADIEYPRLADRIRRRLEA